MGIRTRTIIERDLAGRERDVEIPRIDYREQERQDGTTLVSDVVEQLEFICEQYTVPVHVKEESRKIIDRLAKHDKGLNGHVFMLERRMAVLEKRLEESKGDKTRLDIPWVRQELSMLRWMKVRI